MRVCAIYGVVFEEVELKDVIPSFPVIYQLIASANQIYKKEGICKMWMGMKPLILLYSPDDVEVI